MTARTGRSVKREVRMPFDLAQAIDDDTAERDQSFSDWIRAAAVVRLDGKYEPPPPPPERQVRQVSPEEAERAAQRAAERAAEQARIRAIVDQPTVNEIKVGIAAKPPCPHPRSKLEKLTWGTVCKKCGSMVR